MRRALLGGFCGLLAFGGLGEEEVLWWMVGDPSDQGSLSSLQIRTFHEGMKTAEELGVTDARIRVVGTDDYLALPYAGYDGAYPQEAIPVPIEFYAVVDERYRSATWSFAIELGNYDYQTGTWVALASSEVGNYTDLKGQHSLGTWGDIYSTSALVWSPGNYVVPEPSGGILLLVGGGLLALRRKRRTRG